MNRQSSACQKKNKKKKKDRNIYRCQGAQGVLADGAFAKLKPFVIIIFIIIIIIIIIIILTVSS